jgi:cobalt-zinc-cadmium efflux system membrane fusion protein
MPSSPQAPTILVVDDDEVLGSVLRRVLTREGRTLVQAANAAEALDLADQHPPQLALLDLCLPDGDGVELAKDLRAKHTDLPLILMTAYPMRLREHPELASQFARVLTKPLNLQELRQAVDTALVRAPVSVPAPPAVRPTGVDSPLSPQLPAVKEKAVPASSSRWLKLAVGLLSAVLLAGVALAVTGQVQWKPSAGQRVPNRSAGPVDLSKVELVEGMTHTLLVPDSVMKSLDIDPALAVAAPTRGRPLELPGSTMFDPACVRRIRARFAPAEVINLRRVETRSPKGQTETREIGPGDPVKKGEPLAVFWSVDVSNKKNDLFDAVVQLALDKEILEGTEKYAGSIPEITLLTNRRNVRADENAIDRAVKTLQGWGIAQEDIEAVRKEADEAARKNPKERDKIKKKQNDENRDSEEAWARVVLKAPDDGILVERNVTEHEIVVDNTTNLFVIANIDRLLVVANAPEDDVPILQGLTEDERRWTITTVGATSISGKISEIGYLVDPNQHTVPVKGFIDNPRHLLRAGQFISATIELPPPDDVVEVPLSALVEDGRQSVVFVQADSKKPYYTLRPVQVTARFDKVAFVRSRWSPEEEYFFSWMYLISGFEPEVQLLQPDERVLTAGVVELKSELEDLESKARK